MKRTTGRQDNSRLFSIDDYGTIPLALEILPTVSNYRHCQRLAKSGKIPHRRLNGRYVFSRSELEAWLFEGAPQPAMKWAKEYRERLKVDLLEEAA